jgi:hypothetical protein
MKIRVEATDIEQEFIIGIYKHKVKIVEALKSPNGWTDLVLEGSEINLLKVYLAYWAEPHWQEAIDDFQDTILKDKYDNYGRKV